jgi:thymidylate synthase
MINYLPYDQRKPDEQYENLLREIVTRGKDKVPIHARLSENNKSGHHNSRELSGKCLEFYLENGFPLLTCRDFTKSFRGAAGEMIAFINGADNLSSLREFGCPDIFWDRWVTKEKCDQLGIEEGTLGRGSYGNSFVRFPAQTKDGDNILFDQIEALQNKMGKMPFLRTHAITSWNPPYSMGDDEQNRPREVAVAPCHGNFIHFTVWDDLGEIEMTITNRSSDVPVGLPLNISEWCLFGLMVAYKMGYKFTKYTVFLCNPHYYDIQLPAIERMVGKSPYDVLNNGLEPRRFPTVKVKEGVEVKNLKDFRKTDFVLEDYDPHPMFKIETPV